MFNNPHLLLLAARHYQRETLERATHQTTAQVLAGSRPRRLLRTLLRANGSAQPAPPARPSRRTGVS